MAVCKPALLQLKTVARHESSFIQCLQKTFATCRQRAEVFFSCLTIYCAQQPSSQALHVLAVSSKLAAQYAGDRSVDVDIHLCNIESILCLEREQRLLL